MVGSVLQGVAVCCSALQYGIWLVLSCSVLQYGAACCSMCGSALRCDEECCSGFLALMAYGLSCVHVMHV